MKNKLGIIGALFLTFIIAGSAFAGVNSENTKAVNAKSAAAKERRHHRKHHRHHRHHNSMMKKKG